MKAAGISGIYWPFTAEPHVNGLLTAMELPFAACHEVAHERGFAREDEANYIAYVACQSADDPDFRYSGTLCAYGHVARALRRVDAAAATRARDALDERVLRDLAALRAFWKPPTTRTGQLVLQGSIRLNDAYLKAQAQSDGVRSYGRMVDLLLAAHRAP